MSTPTHADDSIDSGRRSSMPTTLVRVWYGLLIPLLLVAVGLAYWLSDGNTAIAVVGGVTWFAMILIGGLLAYRARR